MALLWTVALYAVVIVVCYGLATKRWPWTASQEEMRADGEQVVAALEEYKATHGEYPKKLYEAGVDTRRLSSYCYYHSRKKGERIYGGSDSVYRSDGYSLTMSSGPAEWVYESELREWTWYPNVGNGG